MTISIDDELFHNVKQIVKGRNLTLFNELEAITPLDAIPSNNTLQQAREIKTQRIKQSIKETIRSLNNQNISVTKYKINKLTGISFITLNKYYDEIAKEVINELKA